MAGLSFDGVADVFDATRELPLPLMDDIVNELVAVLGVDGPILEAGVGTGRFAVPLRGRGIRVVGVDISPKMIARARMKGAKDIFLASATHLPFRDRSFRASAAIHVLHLVAEWRQVLRELSRVTRDWFVTVLEDIMTTPVPGDGARASGPGVAHPLPRYHELAKELGFAYEHPGIRPPDMIARAPPALRRPAGRFTATFTGEQLLAPVATKTYSSQWAIPDEVHTAVMERLRGELEGRTFERTWTVDIVAWRPAALLSA